MNFEHVKKNTPLNLKYTGIGRESQPQHSLIPRA